MHARTHALSQHVPDACWLSTRYYHYYYYYYYHYYYYYYHCYYYSYSYSLLLFIIIIIIIIITIIIIHIHYYYCLLQVNRRKKIIVKPLQPKFPVSPRISVTIGQAQHTVVYGPYFSSQHEHSLFPYVHNVGQTFHTKHNGFGFYLASNSRIMNPLHRPKITDDGAARTEYFSRQKVSQKPASAIMQKLLAKMCGDDLGDGAPELYGELEELLKANRVCNFALLCLFPPPPFEHLFSPSLRSWGSCLPPSWPPLPPPPLPSGLPHPNSPSQAMLLACTCLPDIVHDPIRPLPLAIDPMPPGSSSPHDLFCFGPPSLLLRPYTVSSAKEKKEKKDSLPFL